MPLPEAQSESCVSCGANYIVLTPDIYPRAVKLKADRFPVKVTRWRCEVRTVPMQNLLSITRYSFVNVQTFDFRYNLLAVLTYTSSNSR